jgi:hypothetical protein
MCIQHKLIVQLALNQFAVAVPFVPAKEETAGGEARGGVTVTTVADSGSFIRLFAALDFEATCWNGPGEGEGEGEGGRLKQEEEAEIIEFPTVLYRVGDDGLQEVERFRR